MSLKLGFTLFLLLLLVELPGILSRKCHKCKVHENSPIPVDLPRLCGDNIIDVYKNICHTVWARRRRRRGKYVTVVYYFLGTLFERFRPPLHNTRGIWKRSIIYIRRTIHTNPSRKQSFSKTLFKSEECENAGVGFSGVERKTFGELDYSHQLALLADDFARVAKDETACSQALSCVIKCCLVHGTLLFLLKSSCTIAVINVLSFLSDRYECWFACSDETRSQWFPLVQKTKEEFRFDWCYRRMLRRKV